jgi:hypothetical protein
MTRLSKDKVKHGRVWNGFDYALQVWIVEGAIQDCSHPQEMKAKGCCNGYVLAGKSVLDIPEAQKR